MPDNLFDPDKLQSKLGKLPVWAWGVIGGTVVLAGFYLTKARKNARNPNAAANGTSTDNLASVFTGMATPDQTSNATLPVGGYSGGTISNGDNALGDATLETNQTWLNRGIKIATSTGNTALGSTTALQKYLEGKPVTVYEAAVVNKVLNALGYPPEGSPVLVKAIQDVTTPVVKKNNTVTKIVKKIVKPAVVKPAVVKPAVVIPTIVTPKPDPVIVTPVVTKPKLDTAIPYVSGTVTTRQPTFLEIVAAAQDPENNSLIPSPITGRFGR